MNRVIIFFLIVIFICVQPAKAESPIALIDPTQLSSWHADLMIKILEQEEASYRHYKTGIVVDMNQIAQFKEAQVVVIPRLLTTDGCDNPATMGAVINALKDLSKVAEVYISPFDCAEFDPWVTRVSVISKGERPKELEPLPRGSDLQIDACYFNNWCTDSFAIIKAGLR